jgi:hypothetical protein
MPTAAQRPSAKARSFTSGSECNDTKARQAFCHLDPEIRPEFSTFKAFGSNIEDKDDDEQQDDCHCRAAALLSGFDRDKELSGRVPQQAVPSPKSGSGNER